MLQNIKIRAIIDTNLWVSFLLTKDFSKIDTLVKSNHFVFLFSKESLNEFIEVTQRQKFKKYFEQEDVNNLLLTIKKYALFINVTSNIDICRDPKDNFLLALAKDGKATHLITGDKDLLVLENLDDTKIITITHFFNEEFYLE